ncbi:hypothetical protein [Streptomyces decoyicus]
MNPKDSIHGRHKTDTEFRDEIVNALMSCEVEPYDWCDVDAAAAFMAEDQYTNAPDEFWDVVRRYKRD